MSLILQNIPARFTPTVVKVLKNDLKIMQNITKGNLPKTYDITIPKEHKDIAIKAVVKALSVKKETPNNIGKGFLAGLSILFAGMACYKAGQNNPSTSVSGRTLSNHRWGNDI